MVYYFRLDAETTPKSPSEIRIRTIATPTLPLEDEPPPEDDEVSLVVYLPPCIGESHG